MKQKTVISALLLLCTLSMNAQEGRFAFLEEQEKKVKPDYHLTTDWRLIAGYVQDWQNSPDLTYPDMYLHGGKLGVSIDFNLPYNLSIQTGAEYALTYGLHEQHWASAVIEYTQTEVVTHHVMKHTLNIPVRLCYRQPLYKELSLVLYGGPQLQAGLYQKDRMTTRLSQPTQQMLKEWGVETDPYNRYQKEQLPVNLQISVGGGIEWGHYGLQAGYDFGLLNLARQYPLNTAANSAYMREWSWNVCFVYRLGK